MGLFKPAWMTQYSNDKYQKKAEKSIDKVTSQAMLLEIIKKAPNGHTKSYAVKRLTDQTILEDIARNNPSISLRIDAVYKLIDQSLLADIATSNSNESVRLRAYEKIKNEDLKRSVEGNPAFQMAKKSQEEKLARHGEWFVAEVDKERKMTQRMNEGRCPHCGARLTGWDNYDPTIGIGKKASVTYTCGACGKAI